MDDTNDPADAVVGAWLQRVDALLAALNAPTDEASEAAMEDLVATLSDEQVRLLLDIEEE